MLPARPVLRVLVADDLMLGAGLEQAIACDPELACVARVGAPGDVVAAARHHRPDVVLLGHVFGGGTTLQVVAELVAALPQSRVLVLSVVASDMFARESLRRGASGFIVHSGDLGTLLPRIRACLGRLPAERGVDVIA